MSMEATASSSYFVLPATIRQSPAPVSSSDDVTAATARPKILVVDDEDLIADSIAEILNMNGYEATATYAGKTAVQMARRMRPDLLLTDVLMPKLNGIQTALQVAEASQRTRILLFSGQAGTTDLLREAQNAGLTFKLLPKPVHPDVLLKMISGMLRS